MQFTLFTVPRGFVGAHSVRQHNAIDSWLQLEPKPEIILLADEENTSLVARKYRLVHVPKVRLSPDGVPLISSIFPLAQRRAKHDTMCYVNTDIVLFQDFADALTQVARRFKQFLMIGQRTNLALDARLKVGKKDWQRDLTRLAKAQGRLHSVGGIDYFAFRRGLYEKMLPLAIARYCWDNWLVHDVMRRGIPVVDASRKVLAIHQEHERWPKNSADYRRNLKLYKEDHVKDKTKWMSRICDSSWVLDDGGLKRR